MENKKNKVAFNAITVITALFMVTAIILLVIFVPKLINGGASSTGDTVLQPSSDVSGTAKTDFTENITKVYEISNEFEMPQDMVKADYTDSMWNTTIKYTVFLPQEFEKSKSYPIMLFLHGHGQGGNDNTSQYHILEQMYSSAGDIMKDVIVLSPQCPADSWWNADRLKDGDGLGHLSTAVRLLDKVIKEYNADTERVYIMGYSMGGFGTWEALNNYSDKFAAAVPIAALESLSDVNALKTVPVWMYHGTADDVVNISNSHNMYTAIINAGGKKINFTQVAGADHGVWENALSDRELFSWLVAQKKRGNDDCEYEYIPYFKVASPSGETVVTEKDVMSVVADSEYDYDCRIVFRDKASEKLKKEYEKSDGKAFIVYYGTQKLYEYTVSGTPDDNSLTVKGVLSAENFSAFCENLKRAAMAEF